jgi:hypothetical protein
LKTMIRQTTEGISITMMMSNINFRLVDKFIGKK